MECSILEQRSEVEELREECEIYKKRLVLCSEQNNQLKKRESTAYAKVQNALQMIEIAIGDKNAALEREKTVQGK